MKNPLVILDNGHGDDTLGKRSPKWQKGDQLFEWEFTRDIVEQCSIILNNDKYDSEILVPEKKDITIRERIERANEIHKTEKSIFISIHGNAAPNKDNIPSGIETLYYSKAGKVFANFLQEELVSVLQWKDRGVRKAYRRIKNKAGKRITIYKIAILKFTDPVAILTENGFYTNYEECMKMLDPDVRSNIATATVLGIKKYLLNQKIEL